MDLRSELAAIRPSLRIEKSHHHATWAGTFRSFPEAYIQPESVVQLRKVVRIASKYRKRICVTGCGHSPSDLTCTSQVLINLDKIDRLFQVNENIVTMQAGMRLHEINESLRERGLSMANIGSIDNQSIAGAISTSTHGSSLYHGILSQSVLGLKIMLADGRIVSCSKDEQLDLFRAALVSLGALGIIIEVRFKCVPAFRIEWEQTLLPLHQVLDDWEKDLWTAQEFTRYVLSS